MMMIGQGAAACCLAAMLALLLARTSALAAAVVPASSHSSANGAQPARANVFQQASSNQSAAQSNRSAQLVDQQAKTIESSALNYLQRYGYMSPLPAGQETSNQLISEESFSEAISDFQRFAGIRPTGEWGIWD